MAEYKCKGSHVVQAQQWVDERLGAGTFKGLIKGRDYEGMILPVGWYDVEPLSDVLQQVSPRVKKTVQEMTTEIARLNALKDLTTIYRIFLKMAAPVRVMSFTPRLWSTYVHFGDAVAIKNEDGHYIGECTGIPKALLEWSCGAWLGFVPTAIELAGGRDARGSILGTWHTGPGDLHKLQCEVRYREK